MRVSSVGCSMKPAFQPHASPSRFRSASPGRNGPIGETGTTRSEEHTSELQSLMRISYAVFCLKKKKITQQTRITRTQNIRKLNKHRYERHTTLTIKENNTKK